jgi:xylulokinase
MALLGIDVGTTGCKAGLVSPDGRLLGLAYREYGIVRTDAGRAELDSLRVWAAVRDAVREACASTHTRADVLAVSSLGEAMVPVSRDRTVLGPSILNFDRRGDEYVQVLRSELGADRIYQISGNFLGNHYSVTKLRWIKECDRTLYDQADLFLPWSGFVSFMLGGDPACDFSLANRTLLLDLDRETWSEEVARMAGVDLAKLPTLVRAGTPIGVVAPALAEELGLSERTVIVAGAHDQCATALGCGVIDAGSAAYGMGTYHCVTPTFVSRPETSVMLSRGLNTEHHVVPGRFVTFIYNHGGSMLKWFRDTFAPLEHRLAQAQGKDVYAALLAEMPRGPSSVLVLPCFATTGTPAFIEGANGIMTGLGLDINRGEILKGIVEGVTYYLKQSIDQLPGTGIQVVDYRVAGGGSKSDLLVQTCADVLGRPFVRPAIREAGVVGAAIIAGVGGRTFSSFAEGVKAVVREERTFEPDPALHGRYAESYKRFSELWPAPQPRLQYGEEGRL